MTPAAIGFEKENGDIVWTTTNGDGFLDTVGKYLLYNYQTPEKAQELISHGEMSYIDTTVDSTVYYHRDRDEDWEDCQPRNSKGREYYHSAGKANHLSYIYLYRQLFNLQGWLVYNQTQRVWQPLDQLDLDNSTIEEEVRGG